jgi:hypothetical protein
MKTKYSYLAVALLFAMAITMFGQPSGNAKAKIKTEGTDISNVMGRPAYESTVDSLNTKVWILSQNKYKEIMKTTMGKTMSKMKDKEMKMDKEAKESMKAGTHYFIFCVTNITNGKAFADSSAKVEVVSPSKKTTSVTLQPMMNHFGSGVALGEKGVYLFTINLNVGSGYNTTQFKYKIK